VVGELLVDMVGVEQRVLDQFANVNVGEAVVGEGAVTAGGDDAGEAQLGEVLGDGGRSLAHPHGQVVDTVLALAEVPNDSQAGAVGQEGEGLNGKVELAVVRRYLRICAGSEIVARLALVSDPESLGERAVPWILGSEAGAAASAAGGFGLALALDIVGAPENLVRSCFATGIVLGGWRPALDGIRALWSKRLDVDLLMVVAAGAAVLLGQWRDAALLMVIFASSAALETAALNRSSAGVRALLVDAPETAERVVGDGRTTLVATAELVVGDRVVVLLGGRVPADGVVVGGEAAVDESSLTGESMPMGKVSGASVLAGSSVVEGTLVIEVTVDPSVSVLARLADAVRDAVEQRPVSQLAIERFEQRYSVGVVVVAVLMAGLGAPLLGWSGPEVLTRTMTFLVVASPCAVVLSTMPATLSALAAAARHRVLIRGGDVLEELAGLDIVAFDKTGTLTAGRPRVVRTTAVPGWTADEVIAVAAALERWSEHPIGQSIRSEAVTRGVELATAEAVSVRPSKGVMGVVDGREVRVGGAALVGPLPVGERGETQVGVMVDGTQVGVVAVRDQVRDRAQCTIACLAYNGVTEVVMLTGDTRAPATEVAGAVGIRSVRSGLLPHEKADHVRRLRDAGRRVGFIGDGNNDAAALATATVGVSLGERGTALAIDAADVVIIDDDLHRLADVVDLARRTRRVVRQNLAFALSVIVVLVGLDIGGRLPLILGVVGHEGSSILVALNGLRLLRWRPPVHRPDRRTRSDSRRDRMVSTRAASTCE